MRIIIIQYGKSKLLELNNSGDSLPGDFLKEYSYQAKRHPTRASLII